LKVTKKFEQGINEWMKEASLPEEFQDGFRELVKKAVEGDVDFAFEVPPDSRQTALQNVLSEQEKVHTDEDADRTLLLLRALLGGAFGGLGAQAGGALTGGSTLGKALGGGLGAGAGALSPELMEALSRAIGEL